ncbi:hypothetical protein [Allorhodopirellula heiligendammensis]|nr:hypothetical protein [Allorhodopirellula heiligendammensis]
MSFAPILGLIIASLIGIGVGTFFLRAAVAAVNKLQLWNRQTEIVQEPSFGAAFGALLVSALLSVAVALGTKFMVNLAYSGLDNSSSYARIFTVVIYLPITLVGTVAIFKDCLKATIRQAALIVLLYHLIAVGVVGAVVLLYAFLL